jgi:hypothetical protein
MAAVLAFAAVLAPVSAPAAPLDACYQALAYEKTAASDSVTRQAAYDAAIAGLAANQRCPDAQMKLVNEAYLLSMRASAEHELKVGNWQRDLTRANMLLTQCGNWPGLRGTKAGTDCLTQRQYNQMIEKTLTTLPTARPAPSGSPAVRASGAPGSAAPAPARSAMPLPTPPAPNRPPR